MMHSAEVSFVLNGDDFDPAMLTDVLGIRPTDSIRRADHDPQMESYASSSWRLSTGRVPSVVRRADELADELVERINGARPALTTVIEQMRLNAALEVGLYLSTREDASCPSFGLSARTIAFLESVQASVHVEIFSHDA